MGLRLGVVARVAAGCWVLACGLFGCGPASAGPGDEGSESGGADDTAALDASDGSDSTSSAGTDGSDGTGDGTTTDAGTTTGSTTLDGKSDSTTDTGDPAGCRPLDLLFVVDNSGSMQDEQGRLTEAFPGFLSQLEATLGETPDLHAMVVDVDAWQYETCADACDPPAVCQNPDGSCNALAAPECIVCAIGMVCQQDADFTCDLEPGECEDVLGAGIDHPVGPGASNMACDFATDARYMDSMLEPDFGAALSCAATLGTGSYAETEKTMEAMVEAIDAEGAASGCNAGFLRDDALLVVVFVTDESDDPGDSEGDVSDWVSAAVAAKDGDAESIVVLGLFGDGDLPDAICPPFDDGSNQGAEPAPRLREFVESWDERGLAGSVCAEDYEPFFTDLAGAIEGAGC